MGQGWISIGAVLCAVGVAAAAFGAHALAERLDERALELWELAGRYLIYGGLGLCLVGVVAYQRVNRSFDNAALALLVGVLIFCGSLMAMAFGGPRWLGAVTPVGGTLMILGFLIFALLAARS